MSNIGIPTWVFQLQPWNSEAREPTYIVLVHKNLTKNSITNLPFWGKLFHEALGNGFLRRKKFNVFFILFTE